MVEGRSRHVAFFLMAAMGFLSASVAHHKTHIVGGSYGWRIPNTTTFYQDWANTRDFAVGDKIGARCICHDFRQYVIVNDPWK